MIFIFQCSHGDYVDIGGASNLDPSQMDVKETFCGREPEPAKMVRSFNLRLIFQPITAQLCNLLDSPRMVRRKEGSYPRL